ncbi:ABC transporter substrate-binding protein [Paracoccus sp. (in: a-proteobacteria)]|uniref:ABC transporter substrate-binding protein n=1 Tax=Paracoccus sp. TaxID=267 RepID=UPI0026E03570|nr:ABC transporter substrate-binding protein [Paracoccus sp. (in: a-proteobacteria)]MDO5647412.1 ABC transporter substrate-binding protein [Paracoccus sp. (in: a-proteobacteria)]
MKTTFITAAAASCLALSAGAQDLNVVSWGGAYEAAQTQAFNVPFTEATGIRVNMQAADNPAVLLKAQVEAGNVTADVWDIELSDAIRLCDEGALMEIDPADLPAGSDGTPAVDDFIDGALPGCAVANMVFSTVIAFNNDRFTDAPTTARDFFDLDTYPGKRGLQRMAKRSLYLALIADGVPSDQVYDELATDAGVDRAFAKLDGIKSDIVWWEAGAQPIQLLADGEVAMTTAYNGRVFDAMVAENQPFTVIWDGQYLDMDLFAIPKGAPNPELALDYVKFATATEQGVRQTEFIAYGPPRKSGAAQVGTYKDGVTDMAPHMPTNPAYLGNAFLDDPEFWADRDAELTERFNAWLASN